MKKWAYILKDQVKKLGMQFPKSQKRAILILNAILVFGLLSYALILFINNTALNPSNISHNIPALKWRFFLRDAADTLLKLGYSFYFPGLVAVFSYYMREWYAFPLKYICLYFAGSVVLMLVCVLPFALLTDKRFFYDFLYPVWSRIPQLFIILACWLIAGRIYGKAKRTS